MLYDDRLYQNISINGGFWENRKALNADTTVYSVYNRFAETGRFDALKCDWKEGMYYTPHIFWDSDVAKWIEGASYLLAKKQDEELMQKVDAAINEIEKNQDENGYFNIYFTAIEPTERFRRRCDHELYCAGHMMEAAVAYFEATGKDQLLKAMCKYADYIDRIFRIEKSAAFITPGHPEIELALVRLSRATGNRKYLELSKFFIDERGKHPEELETHYPGFATKYEAQDHLPLREQDTAEGHCVRACYLYSAMADIANEYNDEVLLDACKKIFDNLANYRMYITGGIGSDHIGENFTLDYDLPNKEAYAETCAAYSLILFAHRMAVATRDSFYADIAERALYNGFLSGVSLDGKSFFYVNPLELDPRLHGRNKATIQKDHFPITQRQEMFGCACCPPNVVRMIASLENLLYSEADDTLFIHHYMESEGDAYGTHIVQKTAYPADGNVTVLVNGNRKTVALRIPGWCKNFTINHDYCMKDGYAYIETDGETDISLQLDMPVTLMESHPNLQENSGRMAVMRGPLVYCLEGVDCGENLRDISIPTDAEFSLAEDASFRVPVLKTIGYRRDAAKCNGLYIAAGTPQIQQELKFIPYFGFANRGESEMIVWVLKK